MEKGMPIFLPEKPAKTEESNPSEYDKAFSLGEDYSSYREAFDHFDSVIRPLLPKKTFNVGLEIGSGTGKYTLPFIDSGYFPLFIYSDASTEMLGHIQRKIDSFGLDNANAYPLIFDANSPPFAEKAIDLVFAFGVLHHLIEYESFLKRCHSILDKAGTLCFMEPTEGECLIEYIAELALTYHEEHRRPHSRLKKILPLILNESHQQLHPDDVQRLKNVRDHYRFLRENRLKKEVIEQRSDKWIFETDHVVELLRKTGFSEVTVVPAYSMSWQSYIRHLLERHSVSEEGMDFVDRITKPIDEITNGVLWKKYSPASVFVASK